MAQSFKFGAYAGVIAAASMAITPAYAAETLPIAGSTGTIGYATSVHADFSRGAFDFSTFDTQAETTEYRGRRYRGRRGWRRGRIRGGDVLAGVLVLGGIAAIASAASNNNRRNREERRYEERRDDRRYDRRSNPRASNGSGIDNAVSQCLREIERDVRVDNVDGASRLAEGWVVSGTLFNGSGFTCQIGNDGRISDIDYGGFTGSSYGEGQTRASANQLSDGRYADARAAMAGQRSGPTVSNDAQVLDQQSGPQPAYPGGPLPGETFSE
ncbi:MAG: hypothetical protein ABJN35_09950 [Erythrobacter sp.]